MVHNIGRGGNCDFFCRWFPIWAEETFVDYISTGKFSHTARSESWGTFRIHNKIFSNELQEKASLTGRGNTQL